MSTTLSEFQQWPAALSETEHLEFKEARNQFDLDKLLRYCCALPNRERMRLDGAAFVFYALTIK